MTIIRCAVIGLGRLGVIHAKNLISGVKGAEVSTIVTSREESAKSAAVELGISCWSNDPIEVFTDENIDAVIIATPTNTHADLIIQAARHKKHVFVDKPITETLAQAYEVMEEVEKNNVYCMVGFMRRFDPSYALAKSRIQNGDIGRPLYFKGVTRDPGSPPEKFIKTSGGIFIDMNIHEYDIARFLIGDEVKSIQSFGEVLVHPFMYKYGDVDQSVTVLEFNNGVVAQIEGSRNSTFGYDVRGEVVGTEGSIQIGSLQHHNNIILKDNKSYHDNVPDFIHLFESAFSNEMKHFIECIQQDVKPAVNEIDGKKSLEISILAAESYKKKQKIYLKGENIHGSK